MLIDSVPESRGSTRYVYQQWIRDPNGPLLTKPPPTGVRPPNAMIWGHDLGDFFWIERVPNVPVMTVWSRSMIKEYGENYEESEFEQPDSLQVPRERHPWPVLKIMKGLEILDELYGQSGTRYGLIDEGCDKHNEPDYVPKLREDIADDETTESQDQTNAIDVRKVVRRMLGMEDDYRWVVRKDAVARSPGGRIYPLLWTPRLAIGEGFAAMAISTAPDDDALEESQSPSTEASTSSAGTDTESLDEGSSTNTVAAAPVESHDTTATSAIDQKGKDKAGANVSVSDEYFGNSAAVDEANVIQNAPDSVKVESRKPVAMDQVPAKGEIPLESPFSVADIPKLEEFIPIEYFPDFLFVHDPHFVTSATEKTYGYTPHANSKGPPAVYKRVFPEVIRTARVEKFLTELNNLPSVAHLHLAQQNRFGVGNHSLVHHAPLTLPKPLTAHSRNGRVMVAAKSAFSRPSARELLQNEAKIYNWFPKHLMEDWCGYNHVSPVKDPVPVRPVVPKFYGYYVPVRVVDGKEVLCDEIKDFRSPILLMEECGQPVDPEDFTEDTGYGSHSLFV